MLPLTDSLKDLTAIRDEIERRTNELAGAFGLVPFPIGLQQIASATTHEPVGFAVLTLVFPQAPNLRIIDLPGIAMHPKKGQPENIKDLTANLVRWLILH